MEITTEHLLKTIGEQTVEIRMLREDNRNLTVALRRAEEKNALNESPKTAPEK